MPLRKGHSREVVSSNIKEMVKAGHPVKQAIAASLAMKRKSMAYGGMAEGGEVEDDDADSMLDNIVDIQEKGRFDGDDMGVGGSEALAKALSEQLDGLAYGGLVEDGDDVEPGEVENVPSHSPDTLVHSADLSEAAKEALKEKKKRRIMK